MAGMIKKLALPLSMLAGAMAYIFYQAIPGHEVCTPFVMVVLSWLQPGLIAAMLLVTFCKIRWQELRLHKWQWVVLMVQMFLFLLCAWILVEVEDVENQIIVESAMLCFACPTATAAAVVTRRLGGDAAGVVGYTLLANLLVALVFPTLLGTLFSRVGGDVVDIFSQISLRVFPMLTLPFLAALLLRRYLPGFCRRIEARHQLAFHLWVIALALAIVMTTRTLVHADVSWHCLTGIALVSLLACGVQFALGRWLGKMNGGDAITAGQAMGQKNTVLVIWMGYTFFTPVTALAGGFYSIWHNLVNSWQLWKQSANSDKKV